MSEQKRISRRAVTKSMAWTGPVIVVGAVAPQAAASPTSELVLDQKRSGVGERTFPMEKGKDLVVRLYKFVFALSGKASRGSKFTVTQITAGNAVIWQGQAYGSSAVIVRDTGNISGALKAYAIIAHGKGDTTEGWFTVGLPRGKASFDDSDFARYTEGLALASAAEEPAVSEEPEVVKEPEAEQSKAEQAPKQSPRKLQSPSPRSLLSRNLPKARSPKRRNRLNLSRRRRPRRKPSNRLNRSKPPPKNPLRRRQP